MAAPFCIKCGAAVADGTRFCVKCGQPVGQAAPSQSLQDTQVLSPTQPLPPPPAAVPVAPAQPYVAPPVQSYVPQSVQPPPPAPAKQGSGAGVWIGIFGILLLLGGAGLWFYMRGHDSSSAQVAAAPTTAPTPAPVAAPAPSTTPEVIPPNPDFAQPEVIPPNPDFAKKDVPARPAQPATQKAQPVQPKPATASAASAPRLAKVTNPTSGNLHATVEVAQNGEVVFENLPGARLKFTFDHAAWKPTISHQANGTQTLVMRSLKPGIQTSCDVSWEIVP